MKSLRILLILGLVAVLLACSFIPAIPVNPFGPTATPSASATPIATATSTPTPTPSPAIRIESGDQALFNGDYDRARAEYRQAYNQSADAETRAEALWGLARTEFEAGDYKAAIETFRQLVSEHPESIRAAQAHYLLGEAYSAQNLFAEAATEYGAYASARSGVLDAYALELQGDAYSSAKNYAAALGVYNSAVLAPRLDNGTGLQIKIAQTRAALGDYFGAIALYDTIGTQTSNIYIQAQMDYLAGQAYLGQGKSQEAYARFLHTVENYHPASYSYNSLFMLVEAGVPVNELDRGIVDYFAAQVGVTDYEVALAALDRYIAANPVNDGTAHYYRALSLVKLQNYQAAVDEFSFFITNYPAHPKWAIAWYGDLNYPWQTPGLAYTQWEYLKLDSEAAQTLRDFAAVAPSDPLAIEYLMTAARILESDDRIEEAAVLWETIADQFPGNNRAGEAVFLAGISFYRLGDFARALADFQRSLNLSIDVEGQSRSYLWIGKTQEKLGDAAASQTSWGQAQSLDPTGYYSERARDLLLGRAPFAPATLVDLEVDLAAERVDAAAWVRLTFSLPADTDLSGPGALTVDSRFVRGTELWELGLYDEARLEFEALREAVSTDPADSFRLANYLIDLGLYRSGIYAARQVLTLAGLDEQSKSLQAAKYFSHLRYGLYYRDLIEPAAQAHAFDTLFLFSVVRWESLFEGFVRSGAGARGLMQIMDDTGTSVASQLGWPPAFEPDMLYRPNVSVRLGTYYLANNRGYLDGGLYAALAAYNAGPGNALIWHDLAGGDPDLFLEIIRYAETRDYIRGIYEFYNIYRTLYSPL
jgi:soluble lytic murein transglycosylase